MRSWVGNSSPALARSARRAWAFLRNARIERNNEEHEQRWSPVVFSVLPAAPRMRRKATKPRMGYHAELDAADGWPGPCYLVDLLLESRTR